jgi:predicted transcriptional regulator
MTLRVPQSSEEVPTADEIRALRCQLGLTQEGLADRLQFRRHTVARIGA